MKSSIELEVSTVLFKNNQKSGVQKFGISSLEGQGAPRVSTSLNFKNEAFFKCCFFYISFFPKKKVFWESLIETRKTMT